MYKVKDEFRKNELSLEPGGEEVLVHYPGETRIYDKVKYPSSFAKSIINKREREGKPLPNKIETKSKVLWEKS
jgi:hypothetical protein